MRIRCFTKVRVQYICPFPQELLNAGVNLLDRSVAFELQQRDVAESLRDILQAVMVRHDDGKLEELHLAIDQASKCGMVLHITVI